MHFTFYAKPVEIQGDNKVTGIRLEKTRVVDGRAEGTGEFFEIETGLVIPAIGYKLEPPHDVPFDPATGTIRNDDGRVADGVYVAGWAKRGPTGVIGTNKPDGQTAAAQILEDIQAGTKPGRGRFEALLKGRDVRWIDFAAWKKIDAAEVANAPPGAPREKFVTTEDMLNLLGEGS